MLKVIELFAGIGSQHQALKNINIPHKVIAISEIDKFALQSYTALHGKPDNLGDITKITELPAADLYTNKQATAFVFPFSLCCSNSYLSLPVNSFHKKMTT